MLRIIKYLAGLQECRIFAFLVSECRVMVVESGEIFFCPKSVTYTTVTVRSDCVTLSHCVPKEFAKRSKL